MTQFDGVAGTIVPYNGHFPRVQSPVSAVAKQVYSSVVYLRREKVCGYESTVAVAFEGVSDYGRL
jgi:hypothetical protein